MIYVQLANRYNSTIFTNCCRVAINSDQARCPRCEAEVYPGVDASEHQRQTFRWNWAYGRQRSGK